MTSFLIKAFQVLAVTVMVFTVHVETTFAAHHGNRLEHKPVTAWATHHGAHASLTWHNPSGDENELPRAPEPPCSEDVPEAFHAVSQRAGIAAGIVGDCHRRAFDEATRRLTSIVFLIGPARAPPRW